MNLKRRVDELEQQAETAKPTLYITTDDDIEYWGNGRTYTRAEVDELEKTYQVQIFRIVYERMDPNNGQELI